jgi:hypothetical protein
MKILTDQEIELLENYCNESISDEDFKVLEKRLIEDQDFRQEARTYFSMDSFLNMDKNIPAPFDLETAKEPIKTSKKTFLVPIAIAASISFIASLLILNTIGKNTAGTAQVSSQEIEEVKGSGFAVIDKMIDVQWANDGKVFKNGDAIGQDKMKLEKGIIHLEFYCGASVIIEGPAEFDVNSAWDGFCHKGKLRANVPPAAHGFRIDTPKNKIIDLGTEFGLDVGEDKESVVVFNGEIELHSKGKDMQLLTAGNGIQTTDNAQTAITASSAESFIKTAALNDLHKAKIQEKYIQWRKSSQQWANDKRLITYYNLDNENSPFVRNINLNTENNLDGKIIRAQRVDGRWRGVENGGALEFKKNGSRARVNIPGTFSNFTFSAWVRIDSLNHEWNSLFMGDAYEAGEPHWQLNQDGGLVICVKVYDRPKQWHYLYKSKPIWDPSKSGQWMHVASVYSPTEKRVRQYCNGELVYERHIDPVWTIKKLKIGPAEIGNWGQPRRKDPEFAIRNLNGRIDELMIHDAALSSEEILKIYETGKPVE